MRILNQPNPNLTFKTSINNPTATGAPILLINVSNLLESLSSIIVINSSSKDNCCSEFLLSFLALSEKTPFKNVNVSSN